MQSKELVAQQFSAMNIESMKSFMKTTCPLIKFCYEQLVEVEVYMKLK